MSFKELIPERIRSVVGLFRHGYIDAERFTFWAVCNEYVKALKEGSFSEILSINFGSLFSKKKIVLIEADSENGSLYIKNLITELKKVEELKVIYISKYQKIKNAIYLPRTFKVLRSAIFLTTNPFKPHGGFPRNSITVCFPHSLISVLAEGSDAYLGFDYCFSPTRPFSDELRIRHKKQGYSKIVPCFYDRLFSNAQNAELTEERTVLIALTRSDVSNSLNRLPDIIKGFLPSFKVYFKPHPMDFTTNAEAIKKIVGDFSKNENFVFVKDGDIKEIMKKSSCMITDWSGSGIHYIFSYKRPVFCMDVEFPFLNNGELELKDNFMNSIDVRFREEVAFVFKDNKVPDSATAYKLAKRKLDSNFDKFVSSYFYPLTIKDNCNNVMSIIKGQNIKLLN